VNTVISKESSDGINPETVSSVQSSLNVSDSVNTVISKESSDGINPETVRSGKRVSDFIADLDCDCIAKSGSVESTGGSNLQRFKRKFLETIAINNKK